MDKATLVRSDLETRERVLGALSRAHVPVTLVEVDYVSELEEWQIFVGTPLYDSRGPAEANSRVIKALQDMGIYKDVPIRRVFVKSPNDPMIKALEAEVKTQTEGAIHILATFANHTEAYSVIFAPFTGPGGAVPAKRFHSTEQLRGFLEEDIGIARSSVEEALTEIRRKGSASIFHVQLTRRQAKRMGLA